MSSRAGPSSRVEGSKKRKTIALGMTMKWSHALTTDLLELIKSNPDWRHTFFSRDSAKGHQWKVARDVLCLLCRKQEHGLMRRMEHFGLVKNSGRAEGGGIVWTPTDKWDRADIVTNRAESQLRKLRDDYDKMRAEHSIPDTISTWKDVDKNIRTFLKASYPFFIMIHNLRKYDDALTSHPIPDNVVIEPSRLARPLRQPKVIRGPVKRRASTSSSASSSASSVVFIERPAVKRVKAEPMSQSPPRRNRPNSIAPGRPAEYKPIIPVAPVTSIKRRLSSTVIDRPDIRYHSLEEAMNPVLPSNTSLHRPSQSLSDSDTSTYEADAIDCDPDERHETASESSITKHTGFDKALDLAYMIASASKRGYNLPPSTVKGSHTPDPDLVVASKQFLAIGDADTESISDDDADPDPVSDASTRSSSPYAPLEPVQLITYSTGNQAICEIYTFPAEVSRLELLTIAREVPQSMPPMRPEIVLNRRLRKQASRKKHYVVPRALFFCNQIAIFINIYHRVSSMGELRRLLPSREVDFFARLRKGTSRDSPVNRHILTCSEKLYRALRGSQSPLATAPPIRITSLFCTRRTVRTAQLDNVKTCTLLEFWRAFDKLVQRHCPEVQNLISK